MDVSLCAVCAVDLQAIVYYSNSVIAIKHVKTADTNMIMSGETVHITPSRVHGKVYMDTHGLADCGTDISYNYASARMRRRHTVVVLCVILSFCMSVTPFSQRSL